MNFGRNSVIIAIVLSILIIFVFWTFIHESSQRSIMQLQLEKQKDLQIVANIVSYKNKHGDLDDYMQKLEDRYQMASVSLPEKMEQGDFIEFLQQKALEEQVNITSMNPSEIQPFSVDYKNNSEEMVDDSNGDDNKNSALESKLTMLPINVKMECGYIQLINFLQAIEMSDRILHIENLSLIGKDNGERLICELNIVIFALDKYDE